eukprot:2525350-Amphidinium_carterae.1
MVNQLLPLGANVPLVTSPATLRANESYLFVFNASQPWSVRECRRVAWDVEVLSVRGMRTGELYVSKKSLFAVSASQRTPNNF